MLDYEWDQDANSSAIMLSGGEEDRNPQDSDPTRPFSFFDPTSYNDHRHIISPPLLSSFSNQTLTTNQFHHSFYTTTTTPPYASSDSSIYHHPHSSASPALFSFHQTGTGSGSGSSYNFLIPKTEADVSRPLLDFSSNRIGLNLGGRTYFSAVEEDFVSRLYRRSRPGDSGIGNSLSIPRCHAEGCNADLSHAKHYHRRHKVCEFHSKASTVITAGLTQRFCQQCSRFHLLSEFDNGKRSCRKRLADHNRRRRKCHKSSSSTTTNASDRSSESPNEPSHVLLTPTISLECFRQSTASSSSSNSLFFSSG